MADSPSKYKDRILAWTIYCDGKALDDSYELTYAQIHLAINRIGKATLKFYAGNMDEQTFDGESAIFLLYLINFFSMAETTILFLPLYS